MINNYFSFEKINSFAGRNRVMDSFAIFCARYLIYLMTVLLFVIFFLRDNLLIFGLCFASGILSLAISRIIYFFYKESRPAVLKSSKVLIPVPKNPSFPSSHSAFVFGLSGMIIFYDIKIFILFLVLSCLVGFSRVFCGVHWVRDVFGGVLMGAISSLITNFFINFI